MSNQEMMSDKEPLEYDVGADEQEATVELSEDGKAEITGQQSDGVQIEQEGQQAQESELNEYSDRVKKRIDKLTARLRETQRREEAALAYARSVQTRAQQLEERFKQSDQERLHATKTNLDTQIVTLKQIIRKAREEGDIDTETEAQERLTAAVYEQRRLADMRPVQQVAQTQQTQQVQYPQQTQQQYAQPRRPAPDPKAEDWAERNPWFGKDVAMTHAAQGIHIQLVKDEQFDPTSDEYYDELDRRMRENFPHKFAGEAQAAAPTVRANRPVQTVAPASRSSGVNNARRTIKLTPSQVAIAKRLGVPLEEYARYVKE